MKPGWVRASRATQLREFLYHAEVTLHKRENDFKPLSTMISEAALSALEKTEGIITYRIIALANASTPQPTRSLQNAIKGFKRGE